MLSALTADDNPVMLNLIDEILDGRIEILGRFGDGTSILECHDQVRPDLVILDITMPRMNGLEAAKRISASQHPAKIIILSVYEQPEFVQAAFEAGASCYVFKSRIASDLEAAVDAVSRGERYVSPERMASKRY